MPRRYGLWPVIIRSQFVRQIDLYAAVLADRLLPAFDNIDAEAKKVEDESFDRLLSQSSSEDPDIASLAETARDEGVDFLVMMRKMKQAQINLQTVGLYHLFEQQLFEIHRRLEFSLTGRNATSLYEWSDVKDAFAADGVAIEKLPAWTKVNEFRLVANCAKHAEGAACKQLRQLRPDLLSHPSRRADGLPWPDPDPVVLNPLGGENLYVNLRDFEEYVTSVKSFWSDLASALPI